MNDDVLLTFVKKNLIDVGGDDAKLASMRQAAGDLSGILKKTPAKTLAFSLVAFDPEVPETDPSITEAAEALRKRWETYVNTFASTPVAVCRAMLLDALIQASLVAVCGVLFSVVVRREYPTHNLIHHLMPFPVDIP